MHPINRAWYVESAVKLALENLNSWFPLVAEETKRRVIFSHPGTGELRACTLFKDTGKVTGFPPIRNVLDLYRHFFPNLAKGPYYDAAQAVHQHFGGLS